MKKLIIAVFLVGATGFAQAQFQVNPQMGVTFQDLTDSQQNAAFRSAMGYQVGADLRFGDRLFFQTGGFLNRNATVVSSVTGTSSEALQFEDDLIRTNLKLRAMAGYRIIDSYQFDMRFMAGPSYDVLLSVDAKDDNIDWNKGDFNKGSFNVDAALGFDMGLFSLEPSASFGLSRAFNDTPDWKEFDSKYITYGLTVGVNFGNDD